MSKKYGSDLIALALEEDIGAMDITGEFFIDAAHRSSGRIFAKEPIVLAGMQVAMETFQRVDSLIEVAAVADDGARVGMNQTVLTFTGPTRSLLTAERTVLNFLQRLSGIATLTRKYVNAVAGQNVKILDTRKTTPGMRVLEKAAVRAGGGTNHRMGLYDMAMVKDNHLLRLGGHSELANRIARLKEAHPHARVELEADTLAQVECFLQIPMVDVILLDNMPAETVRQACALRDRLAPPIRLEASGGITLESVQEISAAGVDYISIGALTHSARAVDLSMELSDDPCG